jgi:hypothetical protein
MIFSCEGARATDFHETGHAAEIVRDEPRMEWLIVPRDGPLAWQ